LGVDVAAAGEGLTDEGVCFVVGAGVPGLDADGAGQGGTRWLRARAAKTSLLGFLLRRVWGQPGRIVVGGGVRIVESRSKCIRAVRAGESRS